MKSEIKYIDSKLATEEEKILLNILEKARKSQELKRIMFDIKTSVQSSTDISIYAQRVKRNESPLRTIIVKGIQNACDLTGVLFVVEENNDIYKIVDTMSKKLQSVRHYDLSNNLGIPPYKTVPLCYTILTKLYLKDVDTTVPFEIRIHDKIGILATESNYFLYKKDGISNVQERFKLSGKMLEIIKLRAEIDSSLIMDTDKIISIEYQIRKSIFENRELLFKYSEELDNVFKEYAKNLFRYNNKLKVGHFEFIEGKKLDEEESNYLDEILYNAFDLYYQEIIINYNENEIINIYNRCAQAIDRIKILNFESIFNINEEINKESIKQKIKEFK